MYEHLLVPVDGGELTERAMTLSIEFARKVGARITGFVAEPFAAPAPGIGLGYGAAVTQHDRAAHSHADKVLSHFALRCSAASVPFTPCTTQAAHVDEAILEAACERGCDMIVMIVDGRGALSEWMWGSPTKRLLSRSKLPLLVLH